MGNRLRKGRCIYSHFHFLVSLSRLMHFSPPPLPGLPHLQNRRRKYIEYRAHCRLSLPPAHTLYRQMGRKRCQRHRHPTPPNHRPRPSPAAPNNSPKAQAGGWRKGGGEQGRGPINPSRAIEPFISCECRKPNVGSLPLPSRIKGEKKKSRGEEIEERRKSLWSSY